MLEIIEQSSSILITTQVQNPRAVPPDKLASLIHGDIEKHVVPDPVKAIEKAISLAGTDGLVLVTGSLYLVSDILIFYGLSAEDIY